jgi:hypothetical protein
MLVELWLLLLTTRMSIAYLLLRRLSVPCLLLLLLLLHHQHVVTARRIAAVSKHDGLSAVVQLGAIAFVVEYLLAVQKPGERTRLRRNKSDERKECRHQIICCFETQP